MALQLTMYSDTSLTTVLFTIPFVNGAAHLRSTATIKDLGGDMYGVYTASPYRYVIIDSVDSISYATVTSAAAFYAYGDNFQIGRVFVDSDSKPYTINDACFAAGTNIHGGGSCSDKWAAFMFFDRGINWICVGSWTNATTFTPICCFSDNVPGAKSLPPKGGPDTPPGHGSDISGGRGAYDFDSPGGLGSAMPTSPSLPVSENGRGLHAYTMDAAAYQVLGDALWGVGDSGSSIAFADMWQKWQNYKFNPTAGIINCIRLPDVFTPSRTGLTDTNIKLSGTWAVKGGQFSSISGCKPADVSPISADVLTCSIPEQYGSWLDYDGGIEITLDLPFCGRMQLDPSACVGGGVSVQYRCDPCNGNCAAFVFTTDRNGVTQLYNVAHGNCAFQVPLTGHDDGQVQMLGSFAGSAAALAGAAATPALAAGAVVGAATTMMLRRETTQTVGAPSGSVAYVGNVSPTLIISYAHPVKSPGTLYADTEGQPCEYGGTIGSYAGYTIMHNINVDIPAASAEEREEIARLLESGVIL